MKLGRLNLLTERRRLEAAKLITTGETINLESVDVISRGLLSQPD